MFFEDFKEGAKYVTNGRTVSESDSVLFSTLTGAYNPLFLDEAYAAKTQFGKRIVPGLLTVSICTGLVYQLRDAPFGEGFVALVGMTVKWNKPVFHGNTLHSEVTVAGRKELKDRRALVTLTANVLNQDGESVSEIEYRIIVMQKS